MPFVRLSAEGEEFNIFWRSNMPNDDLSHIHESDGPTLLIAGFSALSIDFLQNQFDDLLLARYNILAVELPEHGRTECSLFSTKEQMPVVDMWSLAA